MKFLVNDNQNNRHAKIRSFLTEATAVIAVLLAAVDLEWTLHRTIRALGKSASADLRDQRISSLAKYKEVWKKEVASHTSAELNQVIVDWEKLESAYQLRHKLVHGAQGATGLAYATPRVERILRASRDVVPFAQRQGVNIYGRRLPIRRKPRSANSQS